MMPAQPRCPVSVPARLALPARRADRAAVEEDERGQTSSAPSSTDLSAAAGTQAANSAPRAAPTALAAIAGDMPRRSKGGDRARARPRR